MPSSLTTPPDIDLIIEKKGGGGGGDVPPAGRNGGGGDDGKKRPDKPNSPGRYYTGIAIAIVAVLMFFMALASAFLVRRGGGDWTPVHIPTLLWLNTIVLLMSSATLEMARGRLAQSDSVGFKRFWLATTILGVIFLLGQVVAWRVLVRQGIYLASNPASSFFYIFTGAHGLHLLGGVCALVYVARKNYEKGMVTRTVAVDVASYYWHFMDALWLFLLALMWIGK